MKFFNYAVHRADVLQFSYFIRLAQVQSLLYEPDLLTIIFFQGDSIEIHNPLQETVLQLQKALEWDTDPAPS
jgi:hypothetical protein